MQPYPGINESKDSQTLAKILGNPGNLRSSWVMFLCGNCYHLGSRAGSSDKKCVAKIQLQFCATKNVEFELKRDRSTGRSKQQCCSK